MNKIKSKPEKYKWHDLRKNPDDVPNINEKVLTTGFKNGYEVQIFRGHRVYKKINGEIAWVWEWKRNTVKMPKAWKYIEPFEEEKENE